MIEPNRKQLDFLYQKMLDACKTNDIQKNSYSYKVTDSKFTYTIELSIGNMSQFKVSGSMCEDTIKNFSHGDLQKEDDIFYKKIIKEYSSSSDIKFKKIFDDYSITERDDKFDDLLDGDTKNKKIGMFDVETIDKFISKNLYPFLVGFALSTLTYFILR